MMEQAHLLPDQAPATSIIHTQPIVTPFLPDHQDILLTSCSVYWTQQRVSSLAHKFDHGLSHLLHEELYWLEVRMHPIQTGSHSASLSAVQGSRVPGQLLYTSLRHCQPTSLMVSHSTSPDHGTGSAISVVGSVVFTIQCSPATASDNRWKLIYFVVTTQHTLTQRSRDDSALYYWHWHRQPTCIYTNI